jgi:hypothetical protein
MTEQVIDNSEVSQEVSQPDVSAQSKNVYYDEDVNRIAGKKRQEGFDSGYKKAMQDLQTPQQSQAQYQQPAQQNFVTQDQLNQYHQNLVQQSEANAIAQRYFGKLSAAKDKYDDFDKVVSKINYQSPAVLKIVQMASGLDNTGDVMYDLRKDPSKYSRLITLANEDPMAAEDALKELSLSIKQNETAKVAPVANEPLAKPKPSSVGVDSGEPSIEDYKKLFKAR